MLTIFASKAMPLSLVATPVTAFIIWQVPMIQLIASVLEGWDIALSIV